MYKPAKLIPFSRTDKNIEYFFIEINLLLISCLYSPNTKDIEQYLSHLGTRLDSSSHKYNNYIFLFGRGREGGGRL